MNQGDDAWSPREELILACAVRSHGVQSWQNVAFEVQKVLTNIKFINPPRIFTPQKCHVKFQDLLLQFENHELDYMIEELRQRQIKELKSEIEHYDQNIELMEQHIKKLQGNEGTDEVKEEIKIKAEEVCGEMVQVEADVGGGQPEEGPPEMEAPSPASDYIRDTMMEFLGILRMYENSSLFEHRLPAQNTEAYTNTIRQHIDLQMVESRIDNRDHEYQQYSYEKFFLDLLLVFNNAIVFFPKSSEEHQTARQLREVVSGVLLKRIRNHVPGRYILFADALPSDQLCHVWITQLTKPTCRKDEEEEEEETRVMIGDFLI